MGPSWVRLQFECHDVHLVTEDVLDHRLSSEAGRRALCQSLGQLESAAIAIPETAAGEIAQAMLALG